MYILVAFTAGFLIFTQAFSGALGVNYRNDLKEKDPEYGETWMYFPDGNGTPEIVNLTQPDNATSSRFFLDVDSNVFFYLYTRKNPDEFSELIFEESYEDDNEIESGKPFNDDYFDPKKDVKIITHGWRSSYQSPAVQLIKDAYLKVKDVNVIAVDWGNLATNPIYMVPAKNTKKVGRKIGRMINYLVDEYDLSPDQFHAIGHSLGAHVVGCAGNETKRKIARLTGLDPAKPLFENWASTEDTLSPDDADFVDAIHTCAGVLGYWGPLGHADFYPNGGQPSQPGCQGLPEVIESCSHIRSYEFFSESILNPAGFKANYCKDVQDPKAEACGREDTSDLQEGRNLNSTDDDKDGGKGAWVSNMGDGAKPNRNGRFYVETNPREPFSENRK